MPRSYEKRMRGKQPFFLTCPLYNLIQMRAHETPFPAAWWGQDLPVPGRPRVGTYGQYPHESLPPLPYERRGDFKWLKAQRSVPRHINCEKPRDNERALRSLIADASGKNLPLPETFLLFFHDHADLARRIRSCTDCFLDVSPAMVPLAKFGGHLARFLADSQGCLFWYLYLPPNPADHCVVVSRDFFGADGEQDIFDPPDPSNIEFCESSFESFICRFWLENHIWFYKDNLPHLPPEAHRYLADYTRSAAD
jgi:hypothetical protein